MPVLQEWQVQVWRGLSKGASINVQKSSERLEDVTGTVENYTQTHADNPSEANSAHAQSADSSISRERRTQMCSKERRGNNRNKDRIQAARYPKK